MSKLPASNAYSLIDELNELGANDQIDELKLRKILNAAEKLNELEDRYLITGICYCLKGDAKKALSNLDAAYLTNPEEYIFDAYLKTSIKLNLENKAYRKALTAADMAVSATVAQYAIRVLVNCNDFSGAKDAIEMYEKAYANQDEMLEKLNENAYFDKEVIKDIAGLDFDFKYLSLITRNIMDYAFEKFDIALTDKTVEVIPDDVSVISSILGFSGASHEEIRELDDFAIEQLIEYETSTDTRKFVFHLTSQSDTEQANTLAC